MTTVSIIGTGNMGDALTALFDRAGASVQSLSHERASEPIEGEIVVLAVPFGAMAELATSPERFVGKTVVDIANAVDQASFSPVEFPAGSGAETLQEALPDAHVVKAFNTNFSAALAAGTVDGRPVSVLVAGDDEDAKQRFVRLVKESGASVFDAGRLVRARELEALGFLQIALAASGEIGCTGGFSLAQ